jgi:hypothetical protein
MRAKRRVLKETSEKETSEKETSEKETSEKETSEKETSEKEPSALDRLLDEYGSASPSASPSGPLRTPSGPPSSDGVDMETVDLYGEDDLGDDLEDDNENDEYVDLTHTTDEEDEEDDDDDLEDEDDALQNDDEENEDDDRACLFGEVDPVREELAARFRAQDCREKEKEAGDVCTRRGRKRKASPLFEQPKRQKRQKKEKKEKKEKRTKGDDDDDDILGAVWAPRYACLSVTAVRGVVWQKYEKGA